MYDKFNSKSKFPISVLRSSNVVMCSPAASLHTSSRAASVLLRAGSVCTVKRNEPRVQSDHTLREVGLFFNKNEHNLFSGLHSSNRFMKLIAEVADGHSDSIMKVNKRCANCGVVRLRTQIRRFFIL